MEPGVKMIACRNCKHLRFNGLSEWGVNVYSCRLNAPWGMYEDTAIKQRCKKWELKPFIKVSKKGIFKKG